jgi:hypothetical protein
METVDLVNVTRQIAPDDIFGRLDTGNGNFTTLLVIFAEIEDLGHHFQESRLSATWGATVHVAERQHHKELRRRKTLIVSMVFKRIHELAPRFARAWKPKQHGEANTRLQNLQH